MNGVAIGSTLGTAPAKPRVLVVDDFEANLVALQALLNDMECEVVVARTGNDALRHLLKGPFAVMLLDVQMPEMDGYEVARHARNNPLSRDVPIIFLTASNNTEDQVLRGYGSGAVDFLFKPINSTVLKSKVGVFFELDNDRRRIAAALAEVERTNGELARAYADLQTTQAQLVQSAKMASLGELVAGVAHEINNPLAFAVSHLDTVRRSLDRVGPAVANSLGPPEREHWDKAQNRLTEMKAGLDRIRELVLKLRTFSRLDEGERKEVSVRECVDSVLMILRHRLPDSIRVESHFGEPDTLECYPGLLNQAIMNLVSNAIDALDEHPKAKDDGGGIITITTGASGGDYEIAVSDTGPGIPADLRHRIFDPFFTTKPVGKGTGLGLSITYSIVQKHRGTIEVRDAPHGGVEMIMKIPLERRMGT